ncbi:hypothetical protein R69927_02565 [Paraburkholderia domus]|jgi:Uncharacterized conserved protein, contains FHA domain|uniref:FHA domain-containing protein n=1 Tax=Paraburkholderia domus TaxID=2793075 RepID=A0A9N8R213_9BURK|nr:FHA domain-containing protein [Paraburkholderia domus]MBK5050741.1 FHA domain-containing protein [Burkholderia sp. R-70006]MBK5059521.1 FHA domain-containing protein [Burkholderia sp. R-70199]MBK5086872.1 FHA domain-containing protein [Burkholderia sp. R-69927]MBK5119613.1 FHA domain-containing protein [Burkholderia sp. R-69980]MBK5167662.1 FHA domain-containing protein [Burkholderia sp. R-70211]MBK5183178.1 FHA domain-containing protein [Burkholderia sp. R-69749]MCI0150545.1 FHA domain-c
MLQPTLKLTILASHGKAFANGACASFDAQGGNIGRAAGNVLRLPDDHAVADRHAAVRAHEDAWHLLNTSGHATLTVNGKLVAAGQETRVRSGDIVNIGGYVLQAAETLPPTWDLQLQRPSSAASQDLNPSRADSADKPGMRGTPPLDPLGFGRLNGLTDDEPPSAGLDGLLDMPVDPLALFGSPRSGWSHANDTNSSDLFADVAGSSPASGFEAPLMDGLRGFAMRDDAPGQGSPLRVKIAKAHSPDQTNSTPAKIAIAATPSVPAFDDPAQAIERTARVAPMAVPQYGEHSQVKAAFRHGEPVKLTPASVPEGLTDLAQAPRRDSRDGSAPMLLALSEAFLEGAGVRPDGLAEATFTPDFMRALGVFVRTLRER